MLSEASQSFDPFEPSKNREKSEKATSAKPGPTRSYGRKQQQDILTGGCWMERKPQVPLEQSTRTLALAEKILDRQTCARKCGGASDSTAIRSNLHRVASSADELALLDVYLFLRSLLRIVHALSWMLRGACPQRRTSNGPQSKAMKARTLTRSLSASSLRINRKAHRLLSCCRCLLGVSQCTSVFLVRAARVTLMWTAKILPNSSHKALFHFWHG